MSHVRQCGYWAFAELTKVYGIESDFAARVEAEFERMIAGVAAGATSFADA